MISMMMISIMILMMNSYDYVDDGDDDNDLKKISYTAAIAAATSSVPYSGGIVPRYSFLLCCSFFFSFVVLHFAFFAILSFFFVLLFCSSYPLFLFFFSVYVSFSFFKSSLGYLCSWFFVFRSLLFVLHSRDRSGSLSTDEFHDIIPSRASRVSVRWMGATPSHRRGQLYRPQRMKHTHETHA